MVKIISFFSVVIFFLILTGRIYSELTLYTPNYQVLSQNKNIEIRIYDTIKLITTSEKNTYREATYSGFRILANYIFGNNKSNLKIPMTAPVITSSPNNEIIDISFVINNDYSLTDLPAANTERIVFKEINLGKVAVITFGMWATSKRIKNKIKNLKEYLDENSIEISSDFLVAQYNSPWIMPPFRKNEIWVEIN